jgi:uracil-DNA glycosylase
MPSRTSAGGDASSASRPTAQELDACRRCELWRHATHGVPGEGPSSPRIMVVGEQPGDQEDLRGAPFVGPAGQILDQAFAIAGLSRDEVYVTNAVKHFKWDLRGKRRMHKTPGQREVMACHYWLQQELLANGSKVVVALGATALKALLETGSVTLGKLMGQVINHAGLSILPTWHPSYVLRLRTEHERAQALQSIVDALQRAGALAHANSPRKGG